jgi:hypothetical protein
LFRVALLAGTEITLTAEVVRTLSSSSWAMTGITHGSSKSALALQNAIRYLEGEAFLNRWKPFVNLVSQPVLEYRVG